MNKTIRAKILKIENMPSRYGGEVYVVYLKSPEHGSFKTWVSPANRNWDRWANIIMKNQIGLELSELAIMNEDKRLVDADSVFKIIRKSK